MRLAFIKLFNIGDALLLTPTLVAVRAAYPGAEITVVTRDSNLGILEGCPVIDRLVPISDPRQKRRGAWKDDLRTILRLRRTKFDFLFELGGRARGRNVAALCRSHRAYSVGGALGGPRHWQFTATSRYDGQSSHAVERDFHTVNEFLPLASPIPPLLFARERARRWPASHPLTDFAVMHIGSREGTKRWHAAGWQAVAEKLLEHVEHLVISTGAEPEEVAGVEALEQRFGARLLGTRGRATWPEMADLLFRARLYVGLDTSVMHLAAACQCPVVALFGPTVETKWGPWRVPHRIVTTRDFRITPADEAEPHRHPAHRRRKTHDIRSDDVLAACEEMLRHRDF